MQCVNWSFPGSSAGKEFVCLSGDPSSIPELGRSLVEGISYPAQCSWASLVTQTVKKSACTSGDLGLIPGLGRSHGGGHGNTLEYSCLGTSHGQRSLVGYSPWGRQELDMTEQLSIAQHSL